LILSFGFKRFTSAINSSTAVQLAFGAAGIAGAAGAAAAPPPPPPIPIPAIMLERSTPFFTV